MPVLKKLIITYFLCVTFLPGTALAEETKKAVLVIIDGVTLEELTGAGLPALSELTAAGGMALMNTNTAGARTRNNASVTVGAGKVALGGADAGLAFQSSEAVDERTAGEIYSRRTGQRAPAGGMVHLGLAAILRANEGKLSTGLPGLLGETLHQADLKTAFIGGGDSPGVTDRSSAAVAMDRSGRIDWARAGTSLIKPTASGLLTDMTDAKKTGLALREALTKTDLAVVETGDMVRLTGAANTAMDSVYEEARQRALANADKVVAEVMAASKPYDSLILVAAITPSRSAVKEGNLLTPLIYWKEHSEGGLLISGTTRRPGIVANTDIAPGILSHFGLPVPAEMSGRPLFVQPAEYPAEKLTLMNRELAAVHRARPPLVKAYILGQIAAVGATVASFFLGRGILRYLQPVLLGLSGVPFAFLILGLFPGLPFPLYALTALAVTCGITSLAMTGMRHHPLLPFLFVSVLTGAGILMDTALGSPLMSASVLGYDPMGGARYYGIGNEYMGVVIGALIIGAGSLLQITGPKPSAVYFILSVFTAALCLIALPNRGANAGGAIAAAAGFGFTAWQIIPVRIRGRQAAWAGVTILLLFAAAALWDAGRSVEVQSHVGRTINLIRTNGMEEAYNIIVRKVLLNLRLLRWTIWSQVFLVTLLGTALLFYRPVGLMKGVKETYPYLIKGFWGVVVGGLTALIFNDSGIVAAATMSIFAAGPIMFALAGNRDFALLK